MTEPDILHFLCLILYFCPAYFRETCQWLKFPLNGLRAQSRVSPVVELLPLASGPACLGMAFLGYETLLPNWQKESWLTFKETSGCVRPEWVNKWPNSMKDIWWWSYISFASFALIWCRWHKQAGLLLRKIGFSTSPMHVTFVIDKCAKRQVPSTYCFCHRHLPNASSAFTHLLRKLCNFGNRQRR